MQVSVAYANNLPTLSPSGWERIVESLPHFIKTSTTRLRYSHDQQLHLMGWKLLMHFLVENDQQKGWQQEIDYLPKGKPIFKDQRSFFNISHSGDMVVCAWCINHPVGVDIEKIKSVELSDFTRVMNHKQWQIINSASSPIKKFFEFWSIKESVIKADGRGLSMNLKRLNVHPNKVSYDQHHWHYQQLNLNDKYAASVAAKQYLDQVVSYPLTQEYLLDLPL